MSDLRRFFFFPSLFPSIFSIKFDFGQHFFFFFFKAIYLKELLASCAQNCLVRAPKIVEYARNCVRSLENECDTSGRCPVVTRERVHSFMQEKYSIEPMAREDLREVRSFYFILFYFILFYFILFYFILFYFILFYFILFYFILLYIPLSFLFFSYFFQLGFSRYFTYPRNDYFPQKSS